MEGIEPSSLDWKSRVIAVIRHSQFSKAWSKNGHTPTLPGRSLFKWIYGWPQPTGPTVRLASSVGSYRPSASSDNCWALGQDRTGSIPGYKSGAPPFVRREHLIRAGFRIRSPATTQVLYYKLTLIFYCRRPALRSFCPLKKLISCNQVLLLYLRRDSNSQ